ncbi:MAG: hypothetical protein RI884_1776 [Pseudomonadota bacterium]
MTTSPAKTTSPARAAGRKSAPRKPAVKKSTPAKAPARPRAKAAPAAPARAARPSAKAAAQAPSTADKADKPRKPKLVRDSFTIPKAEYGAIDRLKTRATQAGHPAKKSELLRAGLMALEAMGNPTFLAALKAVPAIKTGRPAKG